MGTDARHYNDAGPYPDERPDGSRFDTIEESVSWWLTHQRVNVLNASQEDVARRAGISRPAYVKYEHGAHTPSLKTFIRICDVLYLSTNRIIEDAEPEL